MRAHRSGGFPALGDGSDLYACWIDTGQARRALDIIESSVADPEDLRAVKQALGFEAYTGMYSKSKDSEPLPIHREAVFQVTKERLEPRPVKL